MRGKTLYLAVALLLGGILLLPSGVARRLKGWVRDALAPYQALTATAGRHLRQLGDGQRRRHDFSDLETELQTLRRELLLLSNVHEENTALRRQLEITARAPTDLIAARVIARGEMTGWWRTLRINRGSAADVHPPMAVVSEHGLVGRILETSRDTADVLLLSDASSRVSVRILPSATFGVLTGAASHLQRHDLPHLLIPAAPFQLEYLTLRDDIRDGDRVVTSGLGGMYPAGLPIGTVTGLRTDSSGLYRRASVMPAADLARLDTLYVVRTLESEARP